MRATWFGRDFDTVSLLTNVKIAALQQGGATTVIVSGNANHISGKFNAQLSAHYRYVNAHHQTLTRLRMMYDAWCHTGHELPESGFSNYSVP